MLNNFTGMNVPILNRPAAGAIVEVLLQLFVR